MLNVNKIMPWPTFELPEWVTDTVEKVEDTAEKVTESAGEWVGNAFGWFTDPVGSATDALSDTVTSAVDTLVGGSVEELSNYLSEEVANGLVGWFYDGYISAAEMFIDIGISKFKPDIDYFLQMTANSDYWLSNFKAIGFSIAMFLFVFMIIFSVFGSIKLADMKDSPYRIVGGLFISFLIIYFSEDISALFFKWGNHMWSIFLGNSESNELAIGMINGCIPTNLVETMATAGTMPTIKAILTIILGIIFIVQMVKFFMEIIQRYIVACFLYYLLPLPAGTIVSKNASGIFKKYIQMFVVQILMLVLNLMFVKIIAGMLAQSLISSSLMGWLFLLSMIKVGQKIDSYAYTMGLSVAVTGGNVADACTASVMRMMMIGRSMQSGGNAVGSLMQRYGAATGNAELLKAGMKMSDIASMGRGPQRGTSIANTMQQADRYGNLSNLASNLRPSDMDTSMVDMAKNGGPAGSRFVNSLNDDCKSALFNRIYGEGALPEGGSLSSLSWQMNGDVTGNMNHMDKSGNIMSTPFKISKTASPNDIATIRDNENKEMYLSSRNSLTPGQSVNYEFDKANPEKVSMAELATGRSFNHLAQDRESITSVTADHNGSLIFNGSNGETVAKMDREGVVANNKRASINASDFDGLKVFNSKQQLSDFRIKRNDNGTLSVMGSYTKSTGSNGSVMGVKQFTLYNMAEYSEALVKSDKDSIYKGTVGNGTTGRWYVCEENLGKPGGDKETKALHDYEDMQKLSSFQSFVKGI